MKFSPHSLATDRARAKGLGSAKSGTVHFLHERVTSVALVPLTILFVIALIALAGADFVRAVAILRNPVVGLTFLAFVLVGVYHMKIGMQVVIEDYVPAEGAKIVLLLLNTFFSALLALAGVYAIARITLGS